VDVVGGVVAEVVEGPGTVAGSPPVFPRGVGPCAHGSRAELCTMTLGIDE
jgi:hypothetical protein